MRSGDIFTTIKIVTKPMVKFSILRRKLSNITHAVSIFWLLSIPSIKIVYSSIFINLIPVVLLSILALRRSYILKPYKIKTIRIWFIFSIFTIFFLIYGLNLISFVDLFGYLFLLISVFLVLIIWDSKYLKLLNLLIISWGLFLSIWQIFYGVGLDSSLGQHYLTLSLPIAAALTGVFVKLLFFDKNSFSDKIILVNCLIIYLIAIASLFSRSAVIYPIFIALFFFAIYVINNSLCSSLKWILIVASVIILISYFYDGNIQNDFRQMNRLELLIDNPGERSGRSIFWENSLNHFLENPLFGSGLNSYEVIHGFYPHNIFLEIIDSGGLLFLTIFLVIIFRYLKAITGLFKLKEYKHYFVFSGISLYFFLQWNSSFNLTTAYIPITAIFIIIMSYRQLLSDVIK